MSKVELFPGAPLSPKVLLHQCLDIVDDEGGAIVIRIDKDGEVDISMSRIPLERLTFATLKLELFTKSLVSGETPDGAWTGSQPPGAA